jgi:glycosyltransferase involved in cell wall biosynthesis
MNPSTSLSLACPAPFGQGGLGRHLAELVAGVRATGTAVRYFGTGVPTDDPDGTAVPARWLPRLTRFTPVRFRNDWQSFLGCREFDSAVARRLPPGKMLTAFAGAALLTFRRARELGYAELHLESPTAHVRHARRRYDAAYQAHPVERDWLGPRLLARTLAEYELADVIWVNSEYARATFLAEGVSAAKVRRRALSVHRRFRPPAGRLQNSGLNILYVGSLTVSKGIPVLVEAFARFPDQDARLTLVGNTGSRGMARWMAAAIRRDRRVRIAPGDPLPHLHAADVFVYPSHSDGFGYAPMEALACGVPVVVTEDTGMKEYLREGQNDRVVPTGSADPILEQLVSFRRRSFRAAATGPAPR